MSKKISQTIKMAGVTTLALGTLFGCSSKTNSEKVIQGTASESHALALAQDGKLNEAAAEYATIGELLMTPSGIKFADKMLDKALELDPKNIKANFWSAMVKPMVALEGFSARTENLRNKHERTQAPNEIYYEMRRARGLEMVELRNEYPEMNNFVQRSVPGKKAFEKYSEVQAFAQKEIVPNMVKAAERLSQLLDVEGSVVVRFNQFAWGKKNVQSGWSGNCWHSPDWKQWSCNYTYKEIQTPADDSVFSVDKHDIKAYHGALLGMIDAFRLANAYSLDGLDEFIMEFTTHQQLVDQRNAHNWRHRRYNHFEKITTQELVHMLNKQKNLFTLNAGHELDKIPTSTSTLLRHALDLGSFNNEICGKGDRNNNAITFPCLSEIALADMGQVLDLLGGPKMARIGYDSDNEEVRLLVDVRALVSNPPKDLKSLLPTRFHRNGSAKAYPDKTMGGLFPDKDLFEKLRAVHHVGAEDIQ